MLRNTLMALTVLALAGSAVAEPNRTRLNRENNLPAKYQIETGVLAEIIDTDLGTDSWDAVPYIRYGLTGDVALFADIPIRSVERPGGDSNTGLGDIVAGIEFRGWEDIFSAPWIIPHFEVSLQTGDEDDLLGAGENSFTGGLAIGTITFEKLHWLSDLQYRFNDDTGNQFIGDFGIIWDLDEQFALFAEMEIMETRVPAIEPYSDHPILFLGGFSYEVNESMLFSFYGGTQNDGPIEAMGGGKLALSF